MKLIKRLEKYGISKQIIIVISFISMIGILSISYLGYSENQKTLSVKVENQLRNIVGEQTSEFSIWTQKKIDDLEVTSAIIKNSINDINTEVDKDKFNQYIIHEKEDKETSSMYIGFSDKRYIDSIGSLPEKGYDPTNRPWYKQALDKDGVVVPSPRINSANECVVSPSTKIIDKKGNMIGVLSMDIKIQTLIDKVQKNQSFNGQSYSFLIDAKGNIVAHHDKDYIQKNISNKNKDMDDLLAKTKTDNKSFYEMTKEFANKNLGSTSFIKNNEKQLVYFERIPESNWTIAVIVPEKVAYKELQTLKIKYFVVISIDLLLTLALIALYSQKRLVKSVKKASKLLSQLADKDFTINIQKEDEVNREDEIGVLFKSMKSMQDNLKSIVSDVSMSSKSIDSASNSIECSIQDLTEKSNNTLASTQELLAGMEQSSASIEEINASATEIQEVVTGFAKKSQETVGLAESINKRADEVKEHALVSENETTVIYNDSKMKIEKVLEDAKSVEKIDMLLSAIMQITNQTNLLSLNASIESARAGEAGKGFAVVANEIRKLADQSANTVTEIKEIVPIIQGSVSNLSGSCEGLLGFIDSKVIKDYKEFAKVGEEYSSNITLFKDILNDFSSTTEHLNESLNNIIFALNEITETVTHSATETSSITEQTSVINEKVEDIKIQIELNKTKADELKNLMNQFKI